jgi:Ca2+-binding RTX toxin-like protein
LTINKISKGERMSLLSGFNVTLPQVGLLGQAALAAFSGGAIPAGWTVITPQQLGVAAQFQDGNYFTNGGASAIVLQQGSTWIISFRGTDGAGDVLHYAELLDGTYINHFQPLLNAVVASAPVGTHFSFTGASLGGGAANQMADIAGAQYGGVFASATFVAFASPVITAASGILNIGFENDPIYRALNNYADSPSSLDNLVLATSEYEGGNYDGLRPPDPYAHNAIESLDAHLRLQASAFFNDMTPDSVVVFDAFGGIVQDITPGREDTGAFLLGSAVADVMVGRNGGDHIEGFGGNDTLEGHIGDDTVTGGTDNDVINGGDGFDLLFGNEGSDTIDGGPGNNTIVGGHDSSDAPDLVTAGNGNDLILGNGGADTIAAADGANSLVGGFGADLMISGSGNDVVFGNQDNDNIQAGDGANLIFAGFGNDVVASGSGNDTIWGNEGDDTLSGGAGADRYVFASGSGNDQINGFNVGEGDRLDLLGQTFGQGAAGDGDTLLTLSGGGTIELNGIAAGSLGSGFVV